MLRRLVFPLVLAALIVPSAALAASDGNVAALQVRLRALKLYAGPVSGIQDDATIAAVLALQQRAGIAPDGVVGPQTRQVLGTWAQRTLGSRAVGRGNVGWDVAALQFALAWHGFPSGTFTGVYEAHVQAAVRRFQEWAGLEATGAADAATIAAAQQPPPELPTTLASPLGGAVTVAHGNGVRTMYAHLSSVSVKVGEVVTVGETVGLVGATGDATGPHLHFEARLRGAAVDPSAALGLAY